MLSGICQIAVGAAVILVGVFGDEFYSSDEFASSLGKKLPKRSSQAFFILVGLCFVALGVKGLLSPG